MRHLKHRHTLGVTSAHRTAIMANMASSLIEHGKIQTTLTKAKALRPFIEKIITLAKNAQSTQPERAIYLRKLAYSRIRNKKAVNLLFNDKVNEFLNRSGGYTRIYKLGTRTGDAAEMALIELIQASDEGYKTSSHKGRAKKKKTSATTSESATPQEKKEPEAEKSVAEEIKPVEAKKKSVKDKKELKEPEKKTSVKEDTKKTKTKKKKTQTVSKKTSAAKKTVPKKKKS